MDDVVSEVVFVEGDLDFCVGEFVGVIILRDGFGVYEVEVGVVLRFGEVYCVRLFI